MNAKSAFIFVVAFLAGSFSSARSQCFSENDDVAVPTTNDLSGITGFGLTLFKQIFPYKESRNFFFSPYSIWNALALAYFGSSGKTEMQLQNALHVTDKVSTLKKWRSLEFMYKMRQLNNTDYKFNIANRAYFDQSVALKKCVDNVLRNELRSVDMTQADRVAADINSWVDTTTNGRIPELVNPGDISNALMVLTNAAYFKGTWLYQFDPRATQKKLFYTTRSNYSFVDMMVQKGNFRHGVSEELGAHILELPYTGEAVSMIILLPPFIKGPKGFAAMVKRLNATTLHNALEDTWRIQVEVSLPKFTLEQTLGNQLIDGLTRMGIKDLFDPVRANLSAFSDDRLTISRSIHKAFVEVNEEGTEAAAATALISFRVARPVGPQKFECNHPFLFILYDNLTKNILFMGAYKTPKQ